VKGDTWQYERFLKPWVNRKLSAVTHADVARLHKGIGSDSGPYQANRVLALVSSLYGRNLEHSKAVGYTGDNPAKGVEKFHEEKRDRFLSADELGKFFAALHREPSQAMQDFFFLALLTGARRGNVASMTWDDVNLEWRLWRIPGTVAKSGEPIVVPLVPAAVEVLQRRRMGANGSLWVFPSRGKTGHIVEVKGAWKRILTAAGLPDVRPHDLRRTLGSWQAIGGASLPIIGRSLGHSQPSTTQVYARLQLDPVRASVTAATDAMLAAGNGQLLGNDPVLKG